MHNLTQPSATNTQQELVTWVPASLVTTKPSDQGIPPLPPPRGLMPPTKIILPAKSTEQYSRDTKRCYVRPRTNSTHNEKIQKVSTETEH